MRKVPFIKDIPFRTAVKNSLVFLVILVLFFPLMVLISPSEMKGIMLPIAEVSLVSAVIAAFVSVCYHYLRDQEIKRAQEHRD